MLRLFLLLCVLSACDACSASGVRVQSQAADTTARALNGVLPVWLAEADRAAERAGLAACDLDAGADRATCRAAALAAYDATRVRWRSVAVAWDATAAAHDAWRVTLDGCRASHADTCSPGIDAAARYLATVTAWRCAVRAVGHAEWDPLPGAPACTDGGLS